MKRTCTLFFAALQEALLYVSEKKTNLFQIEIIFLGHRISAKGIEADTKKVDATLSWPVPKSSTETCSFLGLLCYISAFLPKLADFMVVLGNLTTKEADKHFPKWSDAHQAAFDSIKKLVISHKCLTTIDLGLLPTHNIYVMTDASDYCSGAVLSFGKT